MSRALLLCLLTLLFSVTGCAKEKDYIDAVRAQLSAYREVTKALSEVRDEKSMVSAKAVLDLRFDEISKAASKIQALPRPSAEQLAKLDQEQAGMKRAVESLKMEVARIYRLPGGPAFLKQFETKSPGLLSAEQP